MCFTSLKFSCFFFRKKSNKKTPNPQNSPERPNVAFCLCFKLFFANPYFDGRRSNPRLSTAIKAGCKMRSNSCGLDQSPLFCSVLEQLLFSHRVQSLHLCLILVSISKIKISSSLLYESCIINFSCFKTKVLCWNFLELFAGIITLTLQTIIDEKTNPDSTDYPDPSPDRTV